MRCRLSAPPSFRSLPMAVPPNVSPTAFNAALATWRQAVGAAEWVFTSPKTWPCTCVTLIRPTGAKSKNASHLPPWHPQRSSRCRPWCVPPILAWYPAVSISHRSQSRLWRLRTRVYSGSVVLDLKRMNRRARGQRAQCLCPGRTRGPAISTSTTTSPKPGSTSGLIPPDPGWEQRDRQCTGWWRRLDRLPVPRPFWRALRHGGGTGQW